MACVVCGSSRRPKRRKVLVDLATSTCSECGFITADFPLAQHGVGDYEQLDLARYDQSIGAMRRHEAAAFVATIKARGGMPTTWLDVGCGVGSVLREARAAGYTVVGVEPDRIARETASAAAGGAIVKKWFDADTVPDASQGIISMLDVLEHIAPERLVETAALVRAKLAPQGYWLIKVPSADGLFYTLANAVARASRWLAADVIRRLWMVNYLAPHRVYFREATMKLFLARNGFDTAALWYLPAVPTRTIADRLTMDATISPRKAALIAPAIVAVNALERLRRRTDSLVVLARKSS